MFEPKKHIKIIAKNCDFSQKQVGELNTLISQILSSLLNEFGEVKINGFGNLHSNKKPTHMQKPSENELVKRLCLLSDIKKENAETFVKCFFHYIALNLGETYNFVFKIDGVGKFYNITSEYFGKQYYNNSIPLYRIAKVAFKSVARTEGEKIKFDRHFDISDTLDLEINE